MSIDQHSRARQIELGRSIAERRKVFLDIRYWIILRDAASGARSDTAAQGLLNSLRSGVASGALICPISASIFMELLKQPYTPERRIGTAKLIDQLSLGVTIIPPDRLTATEINRFLLELRGKTNLYEMQELIWSKVSYVLGDVHPTLEGIDDAAQLQLQKDFFDHMWGLPLELIVDQIGTSPIERDRFAEVSADTNVKNKEYAHELRSYPSTYDIELRGAVDVASGPASFMLAAFIGEDAGTPIEITQEQLSQLRNAAKNILYYGFKKVGAKNALRTIHIGASIHASMRWDKQRQFVANDYYDIEHATAALSYCDIFLTEKSLHMLVTRPQLALEKVNGCVVISDLNEAARHFAS